MVPGLAASYIRQNSLSVTYRHSLDGDYLPRMFLKGFACHRNPHCASEVISSLAPACGFEVHCADRHSFCLRKRLPNPGESIWVLWSWQCNRSGLTGHCKAVMENVRAGHISM